MLGQPISLRLPEVVGVKLTGKLNDGLTATDLVLTITEKLRKLMWLENLLNFLDEELKIFHFLRDQLFQIWLQSMAQRVDFFPVDNETLKYLKVTGRDKKRYNLLKSFVRNKLLWHDKNLKKLNIIKY